MATWWMAVGCAVLVGVGCGSVDQRPGDAADDGAADAGFDAAADGPQVVLQEVPLRIAVGDTVSLRFTVMDSPGTEVAWSILAEAERVSPASGLVATSDEGLAQLELSYFAPDVPGDRTLELRLAGSATVTADVVLRIRVLTAYGDHQPYPDNGGQFITADYLFGQQVTIEQDGYLMRLGLVSASAGYRARLALYADVGGVPLDLVAGMEATAPVLVGATAFSIAPISIEAGTYWIMVNPTLSAPIHQSPTDSSPHAAVGLGTSAPLPSTLADIETLSSRRNNLYVLVADN